MREKKDESRKQRQLRLYQLLQKADGYVTREELCQELHVSKATLTSDLKALAAGGVQLDSPNRSGKVALLSNQTFYEDITLRSIRLWEILLILYERPSAGFAIGDLLLALYKKVGIVDPDNPDIVCDMKNLKHRISAEENRQLKLSLTGSADQELPFSAHTILKDIEWLQKEGWIKHTIAEKKPLDDGEDDGQKKSVHNYYKYCPSAQAPLVLRKTDRDLAGFCKKYVESITTSRFRDALTDLYSAGSVLTWQIESKEDLPVYITRGAQSILTGKMINNLHRLTDVNHGKYAVDLSWRTRGGRTKHITFFVGLVVYAQEKNMLYLVGEDSSHTLSTIPLDTIITSSICATDMPNEIYDSPEYKKIFDEMFSVSVEKPINVKVRFQCFGNIQNKVELLASARKHTDARITYITDENGQTTELIYEDRLRGLEDFSRYLRQFGKSAIAVEPPELVRHMKTSAQRMINLYQSSSATSSDSE